MNELGNLTSLTDKYFHVFLDYLPKIVAALIILLVGLWLIKVLVRTLQKIFVKRNYDEALRHFLLNVLNVGLKMLLIIIVIAKLGIETSSLVAMFGAGALAVGLALQGSLANFAGGVIIILLRPFKIGDWIEADGISGTVKDVSIFYTKIVNFNNLLILVPNGQLSNKKVINYTVEGRRKDAMNIRVSYGTDIQEARNVLIDLVFEQEGVYKDPAPQVVVNDLAEDCIVLSVRFVSSTDDFWRIHWNILEHAENRLKSAGIQIAYPRYDVRLINPETSATGEEIKPD